MQRTHVDDAYNYLLVERGLKMAKPNPYEVDLDKNAANYVPLSPLSFIERTAAVYPQRTAVIHGGLRRTWRETYERCVRLASAFARRGIGIGDTVAVMSPNIPECLEAHFGVPMSGAVLNALNIRLDADTIAFILQHSEAKVLITDREFSPVIGKALERLANKPRGDRYRRSSGQGRGPARQA